ncbi:MAG: hypothetical protein KAH32_09085 [Chlamydiia bacterium]|nr:hypothetical protein [Chlamydiia bacterium]
MQVRRATMPNSREVEAQKNRAAEMQQANMLEMQTREALERQAQRQQDIEFRNRERDMGKSYSPETTPFTPGLDYDPNSFGLDTMTGMPPVGSAESIINAPKRRPTVDPRSRLKSNTPRMGGLLYKY